MSIEVQKTRLFNAIKKDDLETVGTVLHLHPQLVNCKFETGDGSMTPLIHACYRGASDTVSFMMKYGPNTSTTGHLNPFNVNRSRGGFGTLDEVCPLFVATKGCHLSIVEKLLRAGVKVNQTNAIGQSALHVCSMNRDLSFYDIGTPLNDAWILIMKLLIKNRANVNLQDHNNKTPLHYACEHGNKSLVKILLDSGTDIGLQDKNGLSALKMAAHDHYYVMSTMLEKYPYTVQEKIDAYETIALSYSCPKPYECMHKATSLRMEHDLPKNILEPLECYGYAKEWEMLEELEVHKDDPQQLRLQAILARERIYKEKYIIQPFHWKTLADVLDGDRRQLNALLRQHFALFKQNNDYLYFTENFLLPNNSLFRCMITSDFELLDTETIVEIVKTAMDSCRWLKETLRVENQPSRTMELIHEFEQVLVIVGGLISKMLKRDQMIDNDYESEKVLARKILCELLQNFPEVSSPILGYRAPLAHVLSMIKFKNVRYFAEVCVPFDYDLMQLLVEIGNNVGRTDSDGNTLLHIAVMSVLEDLTFSASHYCGYRGQSGQTIQSTAKNAEMTVRLLLESGMYLHTRNKLRLTAVDLFRDPKYQKRENLKQIQEVMKKYDQFPTLKRIAAIKVQESNLPYQDWLPGSLIKFIGLH